jgi:uncharacterized protein YkwD
MNTRRMVLTGIAAAALVLSSAATCAGGPVRPPAPQHSHDLTPSVTTTEVPTDARQVVTLVNEQRKAEGCGALTVDPSMTAFAENHSEWMADGGGLNHSKLGAPILAENIAYNLETPESLVDAWMDSAGHRRNILNCDYDKTGVGHSGQYWTQVFG